MYDTEDRIIGMWNSPPPLACDLQSICIVIRKSRKEKGKQRKIDMNQEALSTGPLLHVQG